MSKLREQDDHRSTSDQIIALASIICATILGGALGGASGVAGWVLGYFVCHSLFLIKINQFQRVTFSTRIRIEDPELQKELGTEQLEFRIQANLSHVPLPGADYLLPELLDVAEFEIESVQYDIREKWWTLAMIPSRKSGIGFRRADTMLGLRRHLVRSKSEGWVQVLCV